MIHPDPLERHVAALARALRGPARMKRSMLAETLDGLRDAAAAYRDGGLVGDPAAERAVREFGAVADVAPLYQAELATAQARRTALLVAIMFPALVLAWDLMWSVGPAWTAHGPIPGTVSSLAVVQDVVSFAVAALALVLLAATLARRVDARRLTLAVALLGMAGAVVCATVTVVMNLANSTGAAGMVTTNPLVVAAFVVSGAGLVAVLTSTTRALRAAVHV